MFHKLKYQFLVGFIFTSFLVSTSVKAQSYKGWEVGAWLGISYYIGDLNPTFNPSSPHLAGGLNGRYNFNERVATKFFLNFSRVSADDADSPNLFDRQRNLSFWSNITEVGAQIEFNFLPYKHGDKIDYFTPYIMGGFNVFGFSPKARLNGQTFNLRDFGTEGQPVGEEYGSISGALIFGGGMKWDLNENWSINIEVGTRQVFTDYLDDVSTVFPNQIVLAAQRGNVAVSLSDRSTENGIGDPGRQRGNSRDNDSYNFVGISFMRYFGNLECPRISKF